MSLKRPWTSDEETQLAQWRAEGIPYYVCAQRLDRPVTAVQNKALRMGTPQGTPYRAPLHTATRDPIQEAQDRQDRVRALRQEKELLEAVAGERSLRAMVESLFREIVPLVDPPPAYKAPPARNKRVVRETALLALSDWHYGEVVTSERVRGFNAYDANVATQRVRGVVASARSILGTLRTGGYEFPRLVIAANGDLVTGTIHDLEKYADGKTIVESCVACGLLLAESVRDLAADFPQVDVFCTVGNHGRLPDARRMEQKAPLRNWDAFVYHIAKIALANVPNVTVTIPDAYAVGYDIDGHAFLQQHGHDIKSWNGIPFYGIQRYTSRIVALEASQLRRASYFVFGHFHSASSLPHPGGEMFVNGSLIGATEYGLNALGVADKPTQWLLGIHPEHGVTHRWPVYAQHAAPMKRSA